MLLRHIRKTLNNIIINSFIYDILTPKVCFIYETFVGLQRNTII